jgi:hypothetical protein
MKKQHYYKYYINHLKETRSVFDINLVNLEHLMHQLKVEIKKIYPEVVFIFFNGHFSYGKVDVNSDIDLSVILNKNSIKKFSKEELLDKRKAFVELYKRLHIGYGVSFNNQYPGEITSDDVIDDLAKGRGFEVDGNKLTLSAVKDKDYWLKSYEADYRAWMSMFVFNNNKLVYGDKKKFFNLRIDIFCEILKYCFLKLSIRNMSHLEIKEAIVDFIINQGDSFLGVDRTLLPEIYYDLSLLIGIGIESLMKKRFMSIRNNEYNANYEKLRKWEKEIVVKKTNSEFESVNIYPWKEYYNLLND